MQQIKQNTAENPQINADCNPDKWLKEHYRYLLSYTITRIQDKEMAQDIVQESFLAALENIEKFQFRSSERTWLVAILKNKIADHYRKKQKESINNMDLNFSDPVYEMLPYPDFLPLFGKAMKKLPELWQTVFTMKHMEDQPADVICRKLKLTSSHYWVISHRTRINLRMSLRNHI